MGIGANSSIFSVVNALLLQPLSYPNPDGLAAVWLHSPGIGIFRDWPSPGQYIDLHTGNRSFEEMALAQSRNFTLTGRNKPERVGGMRAQSSLLRILGARPQVGRLPSPDEDVPGKPPIVILSDTIWKRLFNSNPGIVGKSTTLNGNPFTVAGVLQPGFLLNAEIMPSESPLENVDVYLPLPLGPDAVNRRGDENYNILVRLKPGVTVKQAQADVDLIANRIRIKDKRHQTFGMDVIGLREQVQNGFSLGHTQAQGLPHQLLPFHPHHVAPLLGAVAMHANHFHTEFPAEPPALHQFHQPLVGLLLAEAIGMQRPVLLQATIHTLEAILQGAPQKIPGGERPIGVRRRKHSDYGCYLGGRAHRLALLRSLPQPSIGRGPPQCSGRAAPRPATHNGAASPLAPACWSSSRPSHSQRSMAPQVWRNFSRGRNWKSRGVLNASPGESC
jgi:hypothetical protein